VAEEEEDDEEQGEEEEEVVANAASLSSFVGEPLSPLSSSCLTTS
jgi:hypothetical protein